MYLENHKTHLLMGKHQKKCARRCTARKKRGNFEKGVECWGMILIEVKRGGNYLKLSRRESFIVKLDI